MFRRYEPQGYDKRGRHIIDLVPLNPNYPTLRIDACNPGHIVGKVVLYSRYPGLCSFSGHFLQR